MQTFQTILLDIDGTLLDFEANQAHALSTVFSKHHIELTQEVLETYNQINHGLWKAYELGTIDRDTVLYTRFVTLFEQLNISLDGVSFEKEYQSLLAEGAYFIDGALELVKYLAPKYELAIVTNGVAATQHNRLKKSGLDRYMDYVFISESIGYQKPQIEFFDYCFKEMGNVDVNKTLIIGDTLSSDILGGNHANIRTCWYNPKKHENTSSAIVDLEISSLEELYQFL